MNGQRREERMNVSVDADAISVHDVQASVGGIQGSIRVMHASDTNIRISLENCEENEGGRYATSTTAEEVPQQENQSVNEEYPELQSLEEHNHASENPNVTLGIEQANSTTSHPPETSRIPDWLSSIAGSVRIQGLNTIEDSSSDDGSPPTKRARMNQPASALDNTVPATSRNRRGNSRYSFRRGDKYTYKPPERLFDLRRISRPVTTKKTAGQQKKSE